MTKILKYFQNSTNCQNWEGQEIAWNFKFGMKFHIKIIG